MVSPDDSSLLTGRVRLLETQLSLLHRIGQFLARPQNPQESLGQVLQLLHDDLGLQRGLVALADPDGRLHLGAAVGRNGVGQPLDGPGVLEGLYGRGGRLVLRRLGDDGPDGYDPQRPLIAVTLGEEPPRAGVLAVQPLAHLDGLDDHARFLSLVGTLLLARLSTVPPQGAATAREQPGTSPARGGRREPREQYGFDHIIGCDPAMRRVFQQMRQVAKWDTTVLVRGESGTGKELVAQGIHYNSPRAGAPFIKLNCAALPDNLLESELFGHEKGAFTGAMTQRKGRFELAHGGTLFLDELGEISPAFQAKLLRVLQEGEFERVGGSQTLRVDVRIIAATNRDLEAAVAQGEFREDLYYRLNVMPILTPPLRERLGDVADLATFLVERLAKRQGRPLTITDSALRLLARHDWPGNVRELENCLERAAVMSEEGIIDRDIIAATGIEDQVVESRAGVPQERMDLEDPDLDERERVIAALEQAGWVQAKAARLLNMTPRQIAYRIQTLNIRVRRF